MSPSAHGRRRTRSVQHRHLEYFLAVAEQGTIKAAAEQLFLAPSAVSQAVAELEQETGVKLFERSRTGARLTPAGHALVAPANRALRALDDAVAAPAGVAQGLVSTLDIVSIPSLAQEPASTLIGALLKTHPAVRVRLGEPSSPSMARPIDTVLAGAHDVALTELPDSPVPGARLTRMPDQELFAVCPPGTPAPTDGVMPLDRVLGIGLVVAPYFESSDVYRRLKAVAPDLDRALTIRNHHRDIFMSLARAGAGAVLLTRMRAERARRSGCVIGRIRDLPPRPIAAVTRDEPLPPVVQEFLRLCADPGQHPT